jgi:hypothetical protein
MEAIPANFKAYVDQAIKNATAPLYEKIDAQAKTIAAQAKTIRKLEQRLNAYDARLKTRQLVTDNKGTMLKGAVEVRDKMKTLNKLHDFAHGRHVTASRTKELKTKIGEAVTRRSTPRSTRVLKSNSFGSYMNTENIKNAGKAFKLLNRGASGSAARSGSATKSDGRSAKKQKTRR